MLLLFIKYPIMIEIQMKLAIIGESKRVHINRKMKI